MANKINWVTGISKFTHPPYTYFVSQNTLNEKELTEWIFRGNGTGDFEETGHQALASGIESYITHLEEQLELAREYLAQELGTGKDNSD